MFLVLALGIPAALFLIWRGSARRSRLALIAHNVSSDPRFASVGRGRIAIETRPPLRSASIIDVSGETTWALTSIASSTVDVDAWRTLAAPRDLACLLDGGTISMAWEHGAVRARIEKWKPTTEEALKQRLLAFVAVVDALEGSTRG